MGTFEITVLRKSDDVWTIAVEHSVAAVFLGERLHVLLVIYDPGLEGLRWEPVCAHHPDWGRWQEGSVSVGKGGTCIRRETEIAARVSAFPRELARYVVRVEELCERMWTPWGGWCVCRGAMQCIKSFVCRGL
jgi:hypothetical protein